MAFQTFAGHLQDVILTAGLVGLYGLYRAATESGLAQRVRAIGMAAALAGLGVLLSAVQWVPSKELLDRSPRAEGLSWADLTFGSWHPELLADLGHSRSLRHPRSRHGLDGRLLSLSRDEHLPGLDRDRAGGRWCRRQAGARPLGHVLGLAGGAFAGAHAGQVHLSVRLCAQDSRLLGSSREPVRFHLWAAMGVAALAAVGVERLGRRRGRIAAARA